MGEVEEQADALRLPRHRRGPAQESRGIPWQAVVEVEPDRIVVRR